MSRVPRSGIEARVPGHGSRALPASRRALPVRARRERDRYHYNISLS